ncbi:hypothetical protein B566_EDAN014561, partial [Ephemera danica]
IGETPFSVFPVVWTPTLASISEFWSPYRRTSDMHEDGSGRSRERDRHRRGDRPSRFQDRSPSGERERGGRRGPPSERRVYISNIPYEYRWQDLKDLFRAEVGEVEFVELFADEGDKPRGCGIIEFSNPDSVKKAVEKMHRFEVRGRKLVVKENVNDFEAEQGFAGRGMGGGGGMMGRSNSDSRRGGIGDEPRSSRWNDSPRPNSPSQKGWGFTYGLSPAFLESLGIKGPLVNRVFVANLDYKVDEKKLQEVFKLAGKVMSAELNKDKEGKSRGHGVVEYEHPVEAVQAISMLHHQMLFDRLLTVRMDRVNEKTENQPPKLPDGLRGIGMGLGEGGKALQDVSRSLPTNLQNAQMQNMGMAALQGTGMPGMPNQAPMGGLAGMGNLPGSVGMGFSGNPAGMGGLGGVMGSSLGSSLGGLGSGLGGGLGLGGGSGGLGGMLGSSLGQGGNDLGLSSGGLGVGGLGGSGMGSGGLGASGLGSSGLSAGGLGASGYGGNGSSGLGGMGGSNAYMSGGLGSMSGSGSFMGAGGVGGNSGFGMGGSNNAGQAYGNRNFDMPNSFNAMDDREFRGGNFNNGPIKMEPNMDRKPPESDTIVVRNLSQSVTWQMLRDKFREFGDVKFAEIRNKDTGLVRFSSAREAQRAVGLSTKSPCGVDQGSFLSLSLIEDTAFRFDESRCNITRPRATPLNTAGYLAAAPAHIGPRTNPSQVKPDKMNKKPVRLRAQSGIMRLKNMSKTRSSKHSMPPSMYIKLISTSPKPK